MNGKTECCADVPYNPLKISCCGNVTYNPHESRCCELGIDCLFLITYIIFYLYLY